MQVLTRNCLFAVTSAAAIVLTGCAGFGGGGAKTPVVPGTTSLAGLRGNAHGGQNPIAGATVQLYQTGTAYGVAGNNGNGLIAGGGVKTDMNGNFNVTGLYSCTSGTQVYITATGGNTGSGTNGASMIMAGLGLCDNVPNIPYIQMNEVTTVGTVWALAPFMTDTSGVIGIGAPASNQTGLVNAFADINTLVSYATGVSPGTAAPTSATVPSSEIYAFANALAACINSSGSGGACSSLFGYTTVNGTAPGDVVGAAINMAKNPGVNASNILQLGSSFQAFATTFNTTTVNDLTLAVTYTGGGLNAPTAVALDAQGNVWVANSTGNSVTELSNGGTFLSGTTGYSTGTMSAPSAIAIDVSGNVWVTNSGNATLTELSSTTGANMTGSPFSGGGLSGPSSIAFDGLGNIWVSNYNNNSVSEFNSMGGAMSGTSGFTATGLSSPIGVAVNPH